MILLVGLGNPGSEYQDTRHNIGFKAVEEIATSLGAVFLSKKKFSSQIAALDFNDQKILLCKPDTYMNLSGNAIEQVVAFYKIKPDNIFVFHDDIDLDIGKLKYKIGGGNGGHNGLKSLDSKIGTGYHRIRIGIGRPSDPRISVADYVLGKLTRDELTILLQKISILKDNFKLLITKDFEKFKSSISK